MIGKLLSKLGPVVALTLGTLAAGCDSNMTVRIGDGEGVPLAELDQSGAAPTRLILAGPDDVVVTEGDRLRIEVGGDGEAVGALRFTLEDGTLGIMREKEAGTNKGKATVRVTMPSPEAITVAGSGTIDTASLAESSELTIAGSGRLRAPRISSERVELTIAGSGLVEASGRADKLSLTIAGSGGAEMPGLAVDTADLTIAGSGEATFASDGKVAANILGSGIVTVIGRADCTISAMGSGTLRCSEGTTKTGNARAAPMAPTPPKPDAPRPAGATKAPAAPSAPKAPESPKAPASPEAPPSEEDHSAHEGH